MYLQGDPMKYLAALAVIVGGIAGGAVEQTPAPTPAAVIAPVAEPTTSSTTTTTTTAPAPTTTTTVVQATPTVPIHDGRPQAAEGQTVDDAVIIADDGFGFPVETGAAEVRRLGDPYDTSDLAELCVVKPWLCE